MNKLMCKILLLFVVISIPRSANAAFIATLSVETSPQAGGLTLYQYTLTVSPQSSLSSDGLDLTVDTSANLQPIGTIPSGWDVLYDPGDPSIAWAAEQFSPYLPPGSSTVFSFMSSLPPVSQDYTLFGLDDTGQIDGIITGQIVGPGVVASTPEPTSMIPLGTGLVILAGYTLYRHQKSTE